MTEREEIVERLRDVELAEDSLFNAERIAAAICDYRSNILAELPLDECEKVRDKLIDLLTETPTATSGERIADELRKFANSGMLAMECSVYSDKLIAIADRIDAKHREAIASAMNDALCHANDKDMADLGWVRLPKDADGKYWFCGDKIMLPDGNVVEIIGIGGDWLYYCVESVAITVFGRIRAHDKRHYHAPTVEDVLREFAEGLGVPVADSYIAASAAKLCLAGGDAK